jgi:hypothetical protein
MLSQGAVMIHERNVKTAQKKGADGQAHPPLSGPPQCAVEWLYASALLNVASKRLQAFSDNSLS